MHGHSAHGGVLSPATFHRLADRVAHRVMMAAYTEWEWCVQRGAVPLQRDHVVPTLSVEVDRVWRHLQQEADRWYEVKSDIPYEGWHR